MTKTASEIELDVREMVKNSPLGTLVNGAIYCSELRPIDSLKEDIVISFLTGTSSQTQTGYVNVNVYVKDIDNGVKGVLVKDLRRCIFIENALTNWASNVISHEEYYFTCDQTIKTYPEDEIHQHYVNCKLKFKRLTD